MRRWRCRSPSARSVFARRPRSSTDALTIAAASGGIVCYVGLAAIFNNEAALRYAVPFLIALVPFTLFTGGGPARAVKGHIAALVEHRPTFWLAGIAMVFAVVFLGTDKVRLERIVTEHTVVSIPISPDNRAYQARILSNENRSYVRAVQSKVPADATVWAWIDAPFDLDFRRNRVWTYHMDWAVAPWRLTARTPEELSATLRSRGVKYVLWQYRSGFNPDVAAMQGYLQTVQWPEYRVILRSTIELTLALRALAKPEDIVWKDESIEIIALPPH